MIRQDTKPQRSESRRVKPAIAVTVWRRKHEPDLEPHNRITDYHFQRMFKLDEDTTSKA
jgi:hypothetical protein